MKIAVDLDDTIIAQHRATVDILNKKYVFDIDYDKIYDWDMRKSNYDVDKELILDIVYHFRPYHCEPTDNKIAKYFNKIGKEHEIDIVTARWGPILLKFDIYFTLGKIGLKNWNEIILCGKKYKQNMGYDVIIDDNPNLANGLMKVWNQYRLMPTKLIVYNQPWNWSIECEKYPHITRANNWEHVYNIVRNINSAKNEVL